jgi:soluble lytic murein transglycosylase-like protein
MNDKKAQKRWRSYYYKPQEENIEEVEVVIHQPLFIPFLVVVISGLLAFIAIKSIAPIADRLATSQIKMSAVEENTAEKTIGEGQIASFFSPEVKYWQPHIIKWARQYQLDANLIATVMQIESCGNAAAVSHAGAMGLFQVMPFHFMPGENAFDPAINAKRD